MSASSAASSSLSRARTPIIILTVVAAACGIYYLQSGIPDPVDSTTHSTGLHRSNAVVRRRSRRNTNALAEDEPPLFVEDTPVPDQDAEIVARPLADGETVVDDQAFQDDYSWDYPPQQQRTGQNIVQLLFRVSEEATRKNAYVHRGCECNSCGVVPIRGIRYRCANCADYDLCESCESQGLHFKTHIFYKIKVPAPSFGPRHMQPVWYTGDPDLTFRPLQKAMIAKLNRETGFERPELDAYWEQWNYMANTEWREDPDGINLAMDRKTFERCLVPSGSYKHSAPSLIFDRMFAFYDTNRDDLISFPEFLHGLAYRKKKDKWSKIFDVYDIDGDGYVERKDFLRMFRSYYVLYRQMHRDLIESMDEQQMNSTDAHRLITGRQPLSSAFGNDGRFPPAPDPRTGEGKTLQPNGDMEITDGKDVINESADDTGNREDIFRAMLGRSPKRAYWVTMLNPPTTLEQLPEVLRNLHVNDDGNAERNGRPPMRTGSPHDQDDETSSDSDGGLENDENWPPRYINVTEEDAEAVGGPGSTISGTSPSNRTAVIDHAVQRERANREIYERWRKRQFYTDEEEGGAPPADWKDEDDVLVGSRLGESSKAPRPRVHSRSSSKVRFAEELDDFDTRSNPSTSSRSVPERWGGMEIPDAERDAGKEILYQVTQQAFNELLDPFFKEKEDMAVLAAATKADREKYRHLYKNPEFEKWANEKEQDDDARKEVRNGDGLRRELDTMPLSRSAYRTPVWDEPNDPNPFEQLRQRPLDELLMASGFTFADADEQREEDRGEQQEEPAPEQPSVEQNITDTLNTLLVSSPPDAASTRGPSPSSDLLSLISPRENGQGSPTQRSDTIRDEEEAVEDEDEEEEWRDPTLPQFRPNSQPYIPYPSQPLSSFRSTPPPASTTTPATTAPQQPTLPTTFTHLSPTASPLPHLETPPSSHPQEKQKENSSDSFQDQPHAPAEASSEARESEKADRPLSPDHLFRLWQLDREESRMETRGGWARLDRREFVAKVRKEIEDGRGGKMDYLGSWVEFCLP
jgi:Ca2+-binding EF-hand superfamily protein